MTNQTDLPPGLLTFGQFEPLVGHNFDLAIGEERFALTLDDASLLPHHHPDIHQRPPFQLFFSCPDQRILPQQMYQIDHADLPGILLFLVAIGRSDKGITYQAIFN